MTVLFRLRDAEVRYNGRAVLSAVSLKISAGERIALVGESGAGKSTLLKLLFERDTAGAALVPQEFGLVRNLSVFHNVYMARLDRHPAWYNLVNLARPMRSEVEAVRAVLARIDRVEWFNELGNSAGRCVNNNFALLFGLGDYIAPVLVLVVGAELGCL